MEDEVQQLKYACLELACSQSKISEEGNPRDLNSSEAVEMADEFYKFITKKDLN